MQYLLLLVNIFKQLFCQKEGLYNNADFFKSGNLFVETVAHYAVITRDLVPWETAIFFLYEDILC